MREIWFRGRQLGLKKWIYGYLFRVGNRAFIVPQRVELDGPDHTETYLYGFIEVDPETVGQYTGLKEEREVWEGDAYRAESGCVFVVEFREGKFILTKNVERSPYRVKHTDLHYALNNLDIIYEGNIHENPELMEQE